MTARAKQSLPTFSLDGAALGMRAMIPLLPAMVGFGIAIGAAAAAKGLTFFEHVLMSLFVYAGLSQMVALEVWPQHITAAAVVGIALVAATVNARFLLLGAAFRPWFGQLPAWQSYPLLFFMTEPGWIAAMRYRSEGGADIGFYVGGGLLVFVFWMASIAAGYLLGAVVPDSKLIALDLLMPVYFSAMLVPLWRGIGHAIPWVLAGVVALLMHHFVGGWWYVITGALAGIVAAGFIDERD
jgi:predicted branched-subunit amino acid permease